MRTSGRRPGNFTKFVDTSREEVLLEVVSDDDGRTCIGYTLYDSAGQLVASRSEPAPCPQGLSISAGDGELLLQMTAEEDTAITYRLYNHTGKLLTLSDGKRTQIYGHLRMDGNKPGAAGRKPAAVTAAMAEEDASRAAD